MADAVDRFRLLLGNAVNRQLVADVPVGAFLSGGLDSSTICAVAAERLPELQTFSYDFQGSHSEAGYARLVAKAYRTRHVDLQTRSVDLASLLVRLQAVYDEPFADTSALPTFELAGEARRYLKVVLTGDGGDELFGGYDWYKPLVLVQEQGRVGLLRWTAARVLSRACAIARLPGTAAREIRIAGMGLGRSYPSAFAAQMSACSGWSRKR